MCFVVTCWERADLLALVCGVFCEFVTFPLVSWVRCGTWLYRFLIFATLLLCVFSCFCVCSYFIVLTTYVDCRLSYFYNNQSWWIFACKPVCGRYGKNEGDVWHMKGEVQLRSHRQSPRTHQAAGPWTHSHCHPWCGGTILEQHSPAGVWQWPCMHFPLVRCFVFWDAFLGCLVIYLQCW